MFLVRDVTQMSSYPAQNRHASPTPRHTDRQTHTYQLVQSFRAHKNKVMVFNVNK